MAKHRSRRRRSRKSLKGLGALDTTTTLLIVGGVAVVGVGAYFLLRKPAPSYGSGLPPGYPPTVYPGTLPQGISQSAADQLLLQYGPKAIDAIEKYGPGAIEWLKETFGGSESSGSCSQLNNYTAGTCADFKKFGAQESNGCWYGWNGTKSVIWGKNPASDCANVKGLGYYYR